MTFVQAQLPGSNAPSSVGGNISSSSGEQTRSVVTGGSGSGGYASAGANVKNADILYQLLPAETEAGAYPVVLILNVFDGNNNNENDSDYYDELEVRNFYLLWDVCL